LDRNDHNHHEIALRCASGSIALLIPSTAWATHVFSDASDGDFYAAPAEWAKTNNITTGSPANSTTFRPLDPATRGETVTFLKRYHDNVAQPQIDTNAADIAANSAAIAANSSPTMTRYVYTGVFTESAVTFDWKNERDLATFTKSGNSTAIRLDVSGHGDTNGSFCHWQIRIDGATDSGRTGTTYSALDSASAVQYFSGAWTINALFTGLSAGPHTVQLWLRGTATSCMSNSGNFDHTVLVTEF